MGAILTALGEPIMIAMIVKAALLTVVLIAASLVFAEDAVMSALILVTIALAAVTVVIGVDDTSRDLDSSGPHGGAN